MQELHGHRRGWGIVFSNSGCKVSFAETTIAALSKKTVLPFVWVTHIPVYLYKIGEMNVFQSVSGYEYGMVPVPVEGILCHVGNNLLRVHSLPAQAAETVWVSPHSLALPKQDMARWWMGIPDVFLPELKYTNKRFSGRRWGNERRDRNVKDSNGRSGL